MDIEAVVPCNLRRPTRIQTRNCEILQVGFCESCDHLGGHANTARCSTCMELRCVRLPLEVQAGAVASHKHAKHGIKRPERLCIDGTHCPICLREFWARERVIVHVAEKSAVCRLNLLLQGPVLSQEQADHLDSLEVQGRISDNRRAGLRRARAQEPCVRLPGPLVNIIPLGETHGARHPLGHGHQWRSV